MKRTPDPFLVEKFLRAADLHAATTTDEDEDDPADGYNPGPELAGNYNGITLAVQRTHLHDTTARYYWRLVEEGRLDPVADGDIIVLDPTTPTIRVARYLAWHLYALPTAQLWRDTTYVFRPNAGTEHLAPYRTELHMLHQEAFA